MTTEVDPFNPNASAEDASLSDDQELMDFLRGGNVAAVWPTVGFKVGGTILSREMRDQRKNGETAFFVGKEVKPESQTPPHMRTKANRARQLKMTIQSEATGKTWKTNRYVEEVVPDDDGIRDCWIKGELKKALQDALRKAGVPAPEIGGYVEITRGKDNPSTDPTKGGTYSFTAIYVPAAQNKHWTRFGNVAPGSAPTAKPTDTDPFA